MHNQGEKSKQRSRGEMLNRHALLHVRENADGSPSRVIAGRAIVFEQESDPLWVENGREVREVIDRRAVTQELLDRSDIKFTLFHNRQLILARSNHGEGTLHYELTEAGVDFEFEAPETVDGDKALELVRRGDLSGCSFMFVADYYNPLMVERSVIDNPDGTRRVLYRVKQIDELLDMTIAADPAYPTTSIEARERGYIEREVSSLKKIKEEVAQMREAANEIGKLFL